MEYFNGTEPPQVKHRSENNPLIPKRSGAIRAIVVLNPVQW
jgi:hypothetical protein